MADNVTITAGSGVTVAADDIGGGVLAQRVKPVWGPDGTGNDTDVATGKPLPIQVRSSTGLIPIGEPTDAAATQTDATSVTVVSILKQISKSIQQQFNKTIKTTSVNITADTDIIAAVSTKRIKVIAYSLTSIGTNQDIIIFKSNGVAGTELGRIVLQGATAQPYGANHAISAPSFLFATVAGEKLTLDVNQTDGIMGFITYFDDDAT